MLLDRDGCARIAAIDLGTVSSRLSLARVRDGAIVDSKKHSVITDMGQGVDAMSLVLLLVSLGMAQTGFIARYTLFTVIGLLGLAVSLGMTYIGGEEKILIFAAGIAAVLIVPGHILNHKAAKNHVQGA